MLFNSPLYLFVFLPCVVLLYFALSARGRVQSARAALVLASLLFYGYWNPLYLLLIGGSILVNFQIGRLLMQLPADFSRRKALLIVGVGFNLCLLGYYKYSDFLIDNVNRLTGAGLGHLDLILPLAISFFTFQQIAYLVDSYKGLAERSSLLNYSLFVLFFPQLIAGPIVHHREMMPQFSDPDRARWNVSNVAAGVLIFGMGLFKKVVIADSLGPWADAGFADPAALALADAWWASLSYTLQLYYDFSGYTDMAIGAALMLNIRLPVNFNSPYQALDIQDFWRRWHMTLSRWLRDYVYIPLGGNRWGESRTYLNLMATFVLGGLWHGAGWTFVIWGMLHGAALCVHRVWRTSGLSLPTVPAWLLTFAFVNISWVFFRATDLDNALAMLSAMCGVNGSGSSEYFIGVMSEVQGIELGLLWPALGSLPAWTPPLVFAGLFALTLGVRNSVAQVTSPRPLRLADSLLVSSAAFLCLVLSIASAQSQFLYFNF